MKFSLYSGFNQTVGEKGLQETAAWAQNNGYSCVEFLQLDAGNWCKIVETPEQAAQVKQTLLCHGLSVSCYSVAVNLLNGQAAVEYLKSQAELAAALGAPFLHHTLIDSLSFDENAPAFDEVFEQILDRATEVAKYCQTLGITCLYEEQGFYFNGIKNLKRFFKAIKKRCKNVGICGDFGNILFVDESPVRFLRAFKRDIKHVHLKDYVYTKNIDGLPDKECWLKSKKGGYVKDVPFGAGIIDVKKCFKILRSAKYDGVFSLELVQPAVNNPAAMELSKSLFE